MILLLISGRGQGIFEVTHELNNRRNHNVEIKVEFVEVLLNVQQ